jgi:hypothetical protein
VIGARIKALSEIEL